MVIHGRCAGRLKIDYNGTPYKDYFAHCGMRAIFPKFLMVAELGSPHITCKRCIKRIQAINPKAYTIPGK